MTVSAAYQPAVYSGNGATSVFAFSFPILAAADLVVTLRSASGTETLLLNGINYQLTWLGAGRKGSIRRIRYSGATIVDDPTAVGDTVEIARAVPLSQDLDLRNQGGLQAEAIERGLDRAMMISQQHQRVLVDVEAQVAALASRPLSVGGGGGQYMLDVRDATYGAIADGTTNDRAAIQRAIDDAAAAGSGTVYLPAGTYRLSGSYLGFTPPGGTLSCVEHHLRLHGSNIELRGDGMGRTRIITNRPACILSGHLDGDLVGVTLRDLSLVYDGGFSNAGRAHGVFWRGSQWLFERVEFVDFSMGALGTGQDYATTRDNTFLRCRFRWTKGREGIAYGDSEWQFPCVGLQDPGDNVNVTGCFFMGAESIAWTTTSPSVPDICRAPADGLAVTLQRGAIYHGNYCFRNGVEALYVGVSFLATPAVDDAPVVITGNVIDSMDWGWQGTEINFPTYGIVCNVRRNVTISANGVRNQAVGIAASANSAGTIESSAIISANAIIDCAQSVWAINLSDSVISDNIIRLKRTLTAADTKSQQIATRGIFWAGGKRSRVSNNIISGPITGWPWKTTTLAADAHTGDLTITLANASGMLANIEWVIIGYNPGVSLGTPLPISTIAGNVCTVLNSDWAAEIPALVAAGATVHVMRGNPFEIAAITASVSEDCTFNDNTLLGFLFSVRHDQTGGGDDLIGHCNQYAGAVQARFQGPVREHAGDGSTPFDVLTVATPAGNPANGSIKLMTETYRPTVQVESDLNDNAVVVDRWRSLSPSATITNGRTIERRYEYTAQDNVSAICAQEVISLEATGATPAALAASWSIGIKGPGGLFDAIKCLHDGIHIYKRFKERIEWDAASGFISYIESETAGGDEQFKFVTDTNNLLFKAGFAGSPRYARFEVGDPTGVGYGTTFTLTESGGILLGALTDTGEPHVQVAKGLRMMGGAPIKRSEGGANATAGLATLVAGTVTVSTTAVTANSRIRLDRQTLGGTAGHLHTTTRVVGTSFTITSTSGSDTSSVAWAIEEP